MILLAAFIAGLFGSVHCIGMCGGFVAIINQTPKNSEPRSFWQTLPSWLITNSGRIISYTIAGAIAGTIGSTATVLFDPRYVQNIGLILSGGFMVVLGLYLAGWWQGLIFIEKVGSGVWKHIQPLFSKLLTKRGWGKAWLTGLIWGWLPCGLVYSMLIWSMTIATPLGGASIMLAFGLGTLPMLIGMGALSAQLNSFRQNKNIRQLMGAIIIVFGVLIMLGIVHPFHVPLFSNPIMCETPVH